MKRKMFLGIAAVAVAVVSGYNVYQARTSTKGLSDLAKANVEALAIIETSPTGSCFTHVQTEKKTKYSGNGGAPVTISYCENHICFRGDNARTCTEGVKCEFYDNSQTPFDNVCQISCL